VLTDRTGPPSQSLGVDPPDPAVMRRPPRRKDEPILVRALLTRVAFSAAVVAGGTFFVYAYALGDAHVSRREQTMTFAAFVLLDLVSAVQNRGLGCALGANRMLLATVGASALTLFALVYVPPLQAVFQTEALAGADVRLLLALAGAAFALHEGRRRWERKREREDGWASVVEEMA
jgi:Ca2+-transporting ATPase